MDGVLHDTPKELVNANATVFSKMVQNQGLRNGGPAREAVRRSSASSSSIAWAAVIFIPVDRIGQSIPQNILSSDHRYDASKRKNT